MPLSSLAGEVTPAAGHILVHRPLSRVRTISVASVLVVGSCVPATEFPVNSGLMDASALPSILLRKPIDIGIKEIFALLNPSVAFLRGCNAI